MSERTPLLWVAACSSLGGLSQVLFQPANNSASIGAAPPDRQGLAGGLLATGRVLGQSLGIALSGAVFAGLGGAEAGQRLMRAGSARPAPPELVRSFLEGYRGALWASASCALLGALLLVTHARRRPASAAGRTANAARPVE